MSDIEFKLSEDQFTQYQLQGVTRLLLPLAQQNLLEDFLKECCVWLKNFSNLDLRPEELAARLPEIAIRDRKLVSRLYKVSRRFPSVKQLASDKWLAGVSARLMGTEFATCCHFINVRIDLPGEDKYLLPPHQDFPYIQDSPNGVTWWIPFVDTSIEMGPPTVIPGTHKLGILKVKEFDFEGADRSGAKSFGIADERSFDGMSYKSIAPVKFGETILLNSLLLHRSEPNNSSIARLNVQVRFGDPMLQDCFDRNYPEGLYLGEAFSKSYPEYVVNE
jgi:hypothetical protein